MKLGKIAYGRGRYSAAVTLFEAALEEEGPFSHLGGDIQMWLALSYQASLSWVKWPLISRACEGIILCHHSTVWLSG